jgi:hypothetical protein
MSAFQLVRTTDSARARTGSVTRTLYVPDLDGTWRELRLGPAATAALAPRAASRHAGAADLFLVRHAA